MRIKAIDISICLIIFMVLIPISLEKYIFLLDYVPIINVNRLSNIFYGITVPIYGGSLSYGILSMLIPTILFHKLILFTILFLSGYSMYSLIGMTTSSRMAQSYGGFLYMINPYTYIRIIIGHWMILLSYAILPLLLKSFIKFLVKREKKDMIEFVFFISLVSFNIHTLGIAVIAMVIIFLFWIVRYRDTKIIKYISLAGILFILLNLYWILPLTTKSSIIDNIGDKDFQVFATKIESSALFTAVSMYGFWKDDYIYAKDFITFWWIFLIFILSSICYGIMSYYRNDNIGIYVKSFFIIAIIGIILAIGTYGPLSHVYRWLFNNTLLKGMRDSHKFVTMIVLSYSFLGSLGVAKLHEKIKINNRKRYIFMLLIIIALATPFIYSFTFFNGFAGQIKPSDYPADWYVVNNFLNEDIQDFKILFLPWHQYMSFNWIKNKNKVIRNPSQYFFNKEAISGANLEIGDIYREDNSPDQLYIDALLENKNNITNFGELISILNIKYILLSNGSERRKYTFLFKQNDLELVKETENLYVFKNKNEVSKIYQTDDITNISSEKVPVDYEKINPVDYKLIGDISKKYIVFTEPYSEDWKLDGKDPISAYGTVNAYENSGKEIRFERFYKINLPSYIISLIAFSILMILYFDLDKKILKRRHKI